MEKTRYKELEEPNTFHTNVTALKLLDHLTKFCSGLHTVYAVDITQSTKTLFTNNDGTPQFINVMEEAQKKSKWEKLVIQDKYMHAMALELLIQSGEYEAETREW